MGPGLGEAADIVVGEFETARHRVPMPGLEASLVRDHVVARRPPAGKDVVAGRRGDRYAEGEGAMLANRRETGLHLRTGQVVQGAELVIRAPTPPVARRLGEEVRQRFGITHAAPSRSRAPAPSGSFAPVM